MMSRIDLNSDLGESFGPWKMGMDAEVMESVCSANVACGFHAGDAEVMIKTVKAAKAAGVAVGAHPGHPDLQGFGRRTMAVTPDEAYAYTLYQIGALQAVCAAQGVPLEHVKAHGACTTRRPRTCPGEGHCPGDEGCRGRPHSPRPGQLPFRAGRLRRGSPVCRRGLRGPGVHGRRLPRPEKQTRCLRPRPEGSGGAHGASREGGGHPLCGRKGHPPHGPFHLPPRR
jgi:hypothetical protein